MNHDTRSKRSDIIAGEAAEYFVALQVSDAKTKAEFIEWLRISPEHVNEFLAIAALWDTLPDVSAQPSPEELMALAANEKSVIPLIDPGLPLSGEPPVKAAGKTRWLSLGGIAATVAAFIAGGLLTFIPPFPDPDLYSTAIGEQTSIPLPDGSIVTLNTQSTIRVDYSEAYRVIHLTEGEALFEVLKDAQRPFRVIAGSAVIQAVGTQFNVRSVAAEDVTVSVVEGIVDVSAKASLSSPGGAGRSLDTGKSAPAVVVIESVRLTVGQQARIEPRSGQVAVIEAPAVEKAIAWQQRRLVFEHRSLQQVIEEFNRYNDPPIVIDDPQLRKLPISGVFRSNDRESFVQFLAQMQLAESRTRADGTIVLQRAVQE